MESTNKSMRGKGYRLIIFDMDGTLTEELLDFAAIRREIGVAEGTGILEHLSHLAGREWIQAQNILHHHEITAARKCRLHEGARETLDALRVAGVKTALLTRNSATCAACVIERHGLLLDHVASRDHQPHKPHPDSILNILRRMDILPEQTLMVGDYLYDVQAAIAAGVDCALLHMGDDPLPEFAARATYTLKRLTDVLALAKG